MEPQLFALSGVFSEGKVQENTMRPLPLYVMAGALFCTAAAMAQQFAPRVRIVDKIDESRLVSLKGNTHPAANARNDLGRVSPDLPMTDMILVLNRSPEQQEIGRASGRERG